jgi:hypothetical protein
MRWRIKANEFKSVHVTFTTEGEACPPVHTNSINLPQQEVKYLGLHLDRRITWRKYIFIWWKWLGVTPTKMHWLLGFKSKLSKGSKTIKYKAILKPIWICGMQLWGMAFTSNMEILECFQSKVLCMTVDTQWYMPHKVIWRDLQTPTVKEEIHHYSSQ